MNDSKAQAALDRALTEDNLVLVYQPIHDARTRRIVAAEALLRQRRETGEIREAAIITSAAPSTAPTSSLSIRGRRAPPTATPRSGRRTVAATCAST